MNRYAAILITSILVVGLATWYKYFYSKTDLYNKYISSDEQFGQKLNDERKKLGIPLIDANWYTKQVSNKRIGNWTYSESWTKQIWSDYADKEEPFHKEKELSKSIDGEINETDWFENKLNDSISLTLELYFSRYSKKRNENPWKGTLIKITESENDYEQESKNLTIEQADSVLNNWGLKREQ
jgi:hypothetical protein